MLKLRAFWVLLGLLAVAGHAVAADLKVFCPDALRGVVLELARDFVKGRGHRITFEFGTPAALQKRVAVGEAGDVIIGSGAGVDALVKLGRAAQGTAVPIGAVGLGVAVRAAGPRPDLSTPEALRQAMTDARSVALPNAAPGSPGAAQLQRVFEELGLTAIVQAKSIPVATVNEALKRIAAGEIELGFAPSTEVAAAPGVVLAGPLPRELQQGIAFAAAILQLSRSEDAARAFVAHFGSEAARTRLRAAGVEPPPADAAIDIRGRATY